jgi:phospholipase/carboxylesterase
MTQPSLPYLERTPRNLSAKNPPVVVLLHGRGAEAKTIFSVEGLLDPRFHVIAIRGTYPSSIGGYEWFHPEDETHSEEIDDAKRFDEVEKILTNDLQLHVERLRAQQAPLFLWGFSQGAAMALIVGLRGKVKTTGLVPMSGFLPSPVKRWRQWDTTTRILLTHGSNDEVLPAETSKKALAFLESKGITAEYYEYKGRHKMSLESIAYINHWIQLLAGFTD